MNPLDIINLFYAGALALSVNLVHLNDIPFPTELETAVTVEFETAGWGKSCNYSGLMVPYERDWEEPVSSNFESGMETVRPAEPGKIEAYAFVINRKVCPDTGEEATLLITDHYPFLDHFHERMLTFSSLPAKAENYPRWYPQVIAKISRLSSTNSAAKTFMEFSLSASEKLSTMRHNEQHAEGEAPTQAQMTEVSQ